jgi:hypothetical protein
MGTSDSNGKLKGLSPDLVAKLLSEGRGRNQYQPRLAQFMESDEPGVDPKEEWAEFRGKKATTLYQGFRTAAEAAGVLDDIIIRKVENDLFILHKARAAAVAVESK